MNPVRDEDHNLASLKISDAFYLWACYVHDDLAKILELFVSCSIYSLVDLMVACMFQSKKRGLSLEEKRDQILQIFYHSKDFYLVSVRFGMRRNYFSCLNRHIFY